MTDVTAVWSLSGSSPGVFFFPCRGSEGCLPVEIVAALFISEFPLSLVAGVLNRRKGRGISVFRLWKRRRRNVSHIWSLARNEPSPFKTLTRFTTQSIRTLSCMRGQFACYKYQYRVPLSLLSMYSAASSNLWIFSTAVIVWLTLEACRFLFCFSDVWSRWQLSRRKTQHWISSDDSPVLCFCFCLLSRRDSRLFPYTFTKLVYWKSDTNKTPRRPSIKVVKVL